ncbi:GTPase IMAP family member 9 [Chanos chanos]|uniref:GTPase IMAP family member 9 n=1 Tax=Chanos chanos TaxID=29144 RepID=A0A6J2WM56_CHACN|nr:GTPase IMAP family member 9-like [Chanos chanos]
MAACRQTVKARKGVFGDEELRLVIIGCAGPSQFLLTNSILGREEFSKDVCSIARSRKSLGEVAGRRVAVINAPNLYNEDLSRTKMTEELRRSKCLSSPGPHAFLIAFDFDKISPNDIETPKLVMKWFGENSLNYAMVLLAYEGKLRGTALDNRVMRTDWHLRELVEQCGCRYHVFSKNWRDQSRNRELLQKIQKMLGTMGGCYYISRSYRRAEESIRKEEKKLLRKRVSETEGVWQELKEHYRGEELHWQMEAYNARVRAEIRAKAELDNGWLRTSLTVGLGLGFAAGLTLGMIIGSVEGPVGMAVAGAVGGAVGGTAGGAVQVAIEHLEDRVGPHASLFNFNSAFIGRFFRSPRV